MTPKEKAEELFNNYWLKVYNEKGFPAMGKNVAKICALIAVDEIIKEYTEAENHIEDNMGRISIYISYWQEVKQEIEKL